MKKQKQTKVQKSAFYILGVLLILIFVFIHSPLNVFAGWLLSGYAPHLKAIPLFEIGLSRDTDGIPEYRSPLHFEGHYDKDPYIDTIFAKDFTTGKFEKINKNMTKKQVTDLLGEPLSHDANGIRNPDNINQIVMPNDPRSEDCWRYSTDGKLGENGDTSWYSFLVCFKDNVVSEKQANEFND